MSYSNISTRDLSRLREFLLGEKPGEAPDHNGAWASHCVSLMSEIENLERRLDELSKASEKFPESQGQSADTTLI